MQDKPLCEDISSATVATSAVFAVAAIEAQEHWHLLIIFMREHEVLTKLDDKLAMILVKIRPKYEMFLNEDGPMIVQLDKALYGCVESARLWYDHLKAMLESPGFKANPYDICMFNKGSIYNGTQ